MRAEIPLVLPLASEPNSRPTDRHRRRDPRPCAAAGLALRPPDARRPTRPRRGAGSLARWGWESRRRKVQIAHQIVVEIVDPSVHDERLPAQPIHRKCGDWSSHSRQDNAGSSSRQRAAQVRLLPNRSGRDFMSSVSSGRTDQVAQSRIKRERHGRGHPTPAPRRMSPVEQQVELPWCDGTWDPHGRRDLPICEALV